MQNFIKTIINAFQVWVNRRLSEVDEKIASGGAQSDWNQNDETKPDYIKNRPFYIGESVTLVDNLTSKDYNSDNHNYRLTFVAGDSYEVIWNGVSYTVTCIQDGDWRILGDSDDIPFYIDDDGGNGLYIGGEGSWTVTIKKESVVKLDEKFLPDSLANKEDISSVKNLIETPNWLTNDVDGAGYINNRTHYTEYDEGRQIVSTSVMFDESGYATIPQGYLKEYPKNGEVYSYTFGYGREYWVKAVSRDIYYEPDNSWYNAVVLHDSGDGVNFFVYYIPTLGKFVIQDLRDDLNKYDVYFKLYRHSVNTVHPLPEEYIPNTIARTSAIPTKLSQMENDLPEVVVQPNWKRGDKTANDYVKNRTHWEEIVGGTDTITWDGVREDAVYAPSNSSYYYYFISEADITIDDLANGFSGERQYGNTTHSFTVSKEQVQSYIQEDGLLNYLGYVLYIPSNNYQYDATSITFKDHGLYFRQRKIDSTDYTKSFTINEYSGFGGNTIVHKLDDKYLSFNVAKKTEVLANEEVLLQMLEEVLQ